MSTISSSPDPPQSPLPTILVVDDSSEFRAMLAEILTPAGYQMRTAESGELALIDVAANLPDLILLDVRMQGMDGFEVCRRLKAREETRHIPIIMISGYAEVQDWVKGLRLGAADYITKPFHPVELLTRVKTLLALERANVSLGHQAAVLRQANEQLQAEIVKRQRVEQELRQSLDLAERSRRTLLSTLEDQKQAEATLRVNEEKYRILVENIPQKIFTKDRRSVYVSCNENYARDLGITSEKIAGKTDYDFFPKELADKYRSDDMRIVESGETEGIEEQYMQHSEKVWIYTVKTPIRDDDGSTVGILGIFSDITERKRAEEEREKLQTQLSQAQKLEAIGTLAGGIAHDFNNILSAILGYAEFALKEVGGQSRAAEDLQQVITAGKRAVDLVRQILTISRQREQQQQPVKVQYIMKEALKLLRPSISSLIQIKSAIDSGCPAIFADPTEIHQVIMNLCTNAYHAMADMNRNDHVLELRLAPIALDETAVLNLGLNISPGRFVKMSVADTGCGMDAETMARIFEPYFTTKKKGQGTGLGLATVHSIVIRGGGAITVESNIGEGATFCVYFPVYEGDISEKKQPREKRIVEQGTERIMVIDDEEPIVRLLQIMLAKRGYQVSAFTGCDDAMRIFTEQPMAFDLVITDMNMPKVMGTDLAQAFLEIRPDIPIILCTGFSEKVDTERVKAMGIRKLLYKPVESDVLIRLVRKILDEHEVN